MLAVVQSASLGISSKMSHVQSGLAAVESPIVKISDQLCLLQDGVDDNTHMVASQYRGLSNQVEVGRNDVLQNVQGITDTVHHLAQLQLKHEHDTIQRHQEIIKNLDCLFKTVQQNHGHSHTRRAVVRELAGKQAFLKEISDAAQQSEKIHDKVMALDMPGNTSQNKLEPSMRGSRLTSVLGRVCICHRLKSMTERKGLQLGYASLSGEWETLAHWPSCPMADVNTKKRVTMGFQYNGLARILKTTISVSFAMTYGAGGFSISPYFTCIPTVDKNSDPAFRILELIGNGAFDLEHQDPKPFIIACMKKLIRLLHDGKLCPTAVSDQNESLMHATIYAVCFQIVMRYTRTDECIGRYVILGCRFIRRRSAYNKSLC